MSFLLSLLTRIIARLRRLRLHRKLTLSWCICFTIILVLALFLTGNKLFGLSDELSTVLALLGLLMAPILTFFIFPLITFVLATLIAPLIALSMAAITALGAALTFLIAPLIAAVTSLWAWFLATAVGQALVAPLYTALAPIVLKVAPWLTTSKFAGKAWGHYKKRAQARRTKSQPKAKTPPSTGNRKPRSKQA